MDRLPMHRNGKKKKKKPHDPFFPHCSMLAATLQSTEVPLTINSTANTPCIEPWAWCALPNAKVWMGPHTQATPAIFKNSIMLRRSPKDHWLIMGETMDSLYCKLHSIVWDFSLLEYLTPKAALCFTIYRSIVGQILIWLFQVTHALK